MERLLAALYVLGYIYVLAPPNRSDPAGGITPDSRRFSPQLQRESQFCTQMRAGRYPVADTICRACFADHSARACTSNSSR